MTADIRKCGLLVQGGHFHFDPGQIWINKTQEIKVYDERHFRCELDTVNPMSESVMSESVMSSHAFAPLLNGF